MQLNDKACASMKICSEMNDEDAHRLDELMTINELQNGFSLNEIVSMVRENVLQDWLRERFLNAEADALSEKNIANMDNNSLSILVSNTLNIDIMTLCEHEADFLTDAVNQERKRLLYKQMHDENEIIVTNQTELVKAFQNKAIDKVCLYDNVFMIPLERTGITYVGKGNAVISITAQNDEIMDFDENHVYFYGLTIVFHFLNPQQVKITHSSSDEHNNRIIFLCENYIVKDNSVYPHELAKLLMGRNPFESASDFSERVKHLRGVIVGRVYLKDTDYDLWHEAFFLYPIWRVEYIEFLRRYVCRASLAFSIPCEEAKALFENERAQLIYADFATDGDDVIIIRLYLHTDGGLGKIYLIRRLWWNTSWTFGSGSGDAGYGLDLIAVDRDNRNQSDVVSYD